MTGKFLPNYVEAVFASRRLPPKAAVSACRRHSFVEGIRNGGLDVLKTAAVLENPLWAHEATCPAKLKEVDLNKTRLEREIDSLPADAKYRERKLHDMTLRLDSLYDVIVELEEKIEDARLRRDAIKQQAITLENIYKIMVNFDCVYNIINDEEKRNVVTALIKEIEIYRNDESEYPLKRIGLNFPVFKDGGEVTELLWDKGNTVESVVLLSRA